ncbi:NAD-dependent epimerase/dehydratase family protein [Mucilaginibacter sp. UYCu711]|uniref:NAD-dependent epimerase/dehydratase family protein n=1 Tax=Mucilaginibacter sp. UYCu711 TaxID=3156339 RepID=UPI003D230506
MAKILVTGGLGFIGSHTVVELVNAGYEPVIVDDLSNSDPKIMDQLAKIIGYKPPFYKLDLCDEQGTRELAEKEPDGFEIIMTGFYKSRSKTVFKAALIESFKNVTRYFFYFDQRHVIYTGITCTNKQS